jgi:signal transduction histidine kinase
MYNEIIQNEKTGNETVDSFVEKSERELARMDFLIHSLLKLTRLDAGSIELKKSTHNLKAFLEEVIAGFRMRAEQEGKEIRLHCDEHITMSFDEEWLLEAVSNIIKNALDHTEANQWIEIQVDETPIFTRIVVRDNGLGIHPEDVHHIFHRFYRSRFSKDQQGIGIGLTLAKAIIEKHGGSITVESELGRGSAFHLTFPKLELPAKKE